MQSVTSTFTLHLEQFGFVIPENPLRALHDGIYYDLIELPSGGHIPAPMAHITIGMRALQRIPLSHRLRDDDFFFCQQCFDNQHGLMPPFWKGRSFYRCREHHPISGEENGRKLRELCQLHNENRLTEARYIRTSNSVWRV
jgi:hypothetical protein